MGYGTTPTMERVAALAGRLESAPVEFCAGQDIAYDGVLLAVPALLSMGLLQCSAALYELPKGYYGLPSIFLLLALMAPARVPSLEQLRYRAPGEWGHFIGVGPHSRSADTSRKAETFLSRSGARGALEYGVGQTMDDG
jgi:hypothetical protein